MTKPTKGQQAAKTPNTTTPVFYQTLAGSAQKAAMALLATYAQVTPRQATKATQGGITPPKPGTKCAQLWDHYGQFSGGRAAAVRAAVAVGFNPATAGTQYQRWFTYTNAAKTVAPTVQATTTV